MVHQEACQLFIEQEIKEGLAQGKTPYNIGKDLSAWVEKLFETNIPARTIEQKARRVENATNVASAPHPQNHSEIPEKPQTQQIRGESGKFEQGTAAGPGRPQKYTPIEPPLKPVSDALQFAVMAISQLERVRDDDPQKVRAFKKVSNWINSRLKERS